MIKRQYLFEGDYMNNSDKKVFLGGTCNGTNWRQYVIDRLHIDYFNPVVDNWTPECQQEEIRQRNICNFSLFYITPYMTGVYSIAEVVDDSNKKPDGTIFCYTDKDGDKSFDNGQCKSLEMVGNMVKNNGGHFFRSLDEVIQFLNS